MADRRARTRAERGDGTREWETFVRPDAEASLRHVGSVTAPSASIAYEQASELFDGSETVWLCPADETRRYATSSLADRRAGE